MTQPPAFRAVIAIVGTGPAALMAALVLARQGHSIRLFEKKKGPGRKFLIAGSSGLNVTYDAPFEEFHKFYQGPEDRFKAFFQMFPPASWLKTINDLGLETFKGTSRRYFVKGMKASTLLRAWLRELEELGATVAYDHELVDFTRTKEGRAHLTFSNHNSITTDAVCLALGGASWEKTETPLRWPRMFTTKGLSFREFQPSNVGYEVSGLPDFLAEAEGQPLKNVTLTTSKGTKRGDLVVTSYGLEGTPVYFVDTCGTATLDLKPDLTAAQIVARLESMKENRSPLRRVKKLMNLSPAALALVSAAAPKTALENISAMATILKNFPLNLNRPRPLTEAISSSGGLDWEELDESLQLRRYPGFYAMGEMLNWDAPTGGFLIQGCVSQGFFAAQALCRALGSSK